MRTQMAFAAMLAAMSLCTLPAHADDSPSLSRIASTLAQMNTEPAVPPGLTLQGVGEARVTPDIVRLLLGVYNQGTDSGRVIQENAEMTRRMIAAIKRAGVGEKDIQTRNFALLPQYDQGGSRPGGGFGGGGFGGGGRSFYRRQSDDAIAARSGAKRPLRGRQYDSRHPPYDG